MLWTVAWFFLAYDNPRSHQNITEEVPFYPNFMTSPRYLKPLTYISAPNLLLQIKPTQVKSYHRSLRNWTRSLLAQRRSLFLGARWQPRRQFGGSYSPMPQIHLVCALASECPKRVNILYLPARSLYTPEIWACLSQVSSNCSQVYSFLSDPSPIIGYACHLTDSLTNSLTPV